MTHSDIFPSLPLLDYLEQQYQISLQKPFLGYAVLAVQHLLGSSVPLLHALELGGVERKDMYVVGKAYSSHHLVVSHLRDLGYQVNIAIAGYSDHVPYDDILENAIRSTLRTLIASFGEKSQNMRVLLVDDAGKAIVILHEEFSDYAGYFKCVEQTTRGIRELSKITLACPVVNVARCHAKVALEGPLIAQSMVRELLSSFERWREVFTLRNSRVLVLGYGAIGELVCQQLTEIGFQVLVFDADLHKLKRAQANGYRVVTERVRVLPSVGMVVGCTGLPSLPESEFHRLYPGTLLVNMASSDLEFSAWRYRENSHVIYESIISNDPLRSRIGGSVPWRSLYQVDGFFLANGGFPIDFSGEMDPIDPRDIQITRGLMLGAALQAISTTRNGLVELDEALEHGIVAEYQTLLGGKL